MIEIIIVFEDIVDGNDIEVCYRRDTMKEINKLLSLYYKKRNVKKVFIFIEGENENEKN